LVRISWIVIADHVASSSGTPGVPNGSGFPDYDAKIIREMNK